MSVRSVLAALLAGAGILPPAVLADSWSPPSTVDRATAGFRVRGPVVASSAAATTVAWVRSKPSLNVLRARTATRAGVTRDWVVRASRTGITRPTLLTGGGVGVVAWRWFTGRTYRVEARSLHLGSGRVGPLQRLSAAKPDASAPTFVGGDGGVRLAWLRLGLEPDLQVASPERTGRFASTVRYDVEGVRELDATVASGDRLAVAFTRRLPGQTSPSVGVALQGLEGLAEIATFDGRPGAEEPGVAVDSRGRLVVAWTQTTENGLEQVYTAVRERGASRFGDPVLVETTGSVDDLAIVPKADGDTLLTWLSSGTIGPTSLVAASLTGGSRTLNASTDDVTGYAVTTDARGSAHIAYRADGPGTGGLLYATRVGPTELISAPRRVTAPGERASSFSIGASPRGTARVAWTRAGGTAIRTARRVG